MAHARAAGWQCFEPECTRYGQGGPCVKPSGPDKRFSDAELSAEAYRQMARSCALAGTASRVDVDGSLAMCPMDAMADFIGPIRKETYMLGVVNRFVRLPSYDEEVVDD